MRIRSTPFHLTPITRVALTLSLLWLGSIATLRAQEAPRPSLARAYTQTALPVLYNLKVGPVLLRLDAFMGTEFSDNVNYGNGTTVPRESDIVLSPGVGIDALWTVSQLNTLQFHTELSYTKYLIHSKLDSASVLASPDSVLSFNIYVGDFKINLHEQFSYQEDPAQQGAVSDVLSLESLRTSRGWMCCGI